MNRQVWIFRIYVTLLCFLPVISVFTVNVYGSMPVVFFLLILAILFRGEKKTFSLDFHLLAVTAALPVLAAVSYFWAVAPENIPLKAGKELMVLLSGFGIFTLASQLDEGRHGRLFSVFCTCFAVSALLIFEELLLAHPLLRLFKQTPLEIEIIPSVVNHGAVVLSLLYWPFLYLKVCAEKTQLAAAIGFCLFIFLVLFSQSQTAQAAIAAGGFTFAAAKYLPRFTFWTFLSSITLLCLAAPFVFQWGYEHFAPALSVWENASAGARFDIWNAVSAYALQKPLSGYGMEASRNITDFHFEKFYTIRQYIQHPHNNILQIWIELGIIGALWMAGFFSFILLRLRKLEPLQYTVSMACFAACFAVALVGYGLWQAWWAGLLFMTVTLLKIAFTAKRD